MPLSLYAATIPQFAQILGTLAGLLDKAETFCAERALAPDEIIQARLVEDMLPFAYQVKSAVTHSTGAVEGGARIAETIHALTSRGIPVMGHIGLTPQMFNVMGGFKTQGRTEAEWPAIEADARAALAGLDPAEIDGFVGQDMRFEFGEHRVEFTAEGFMLSFSQPNFYFHATTAYDILRARGVPLGKRDFLGRMLIKN